MLRELRPADAADLLAVLTEPAVANATDVEPLQTVQQVEELILLLEARFAARAGIRWALTFGRDDRVMGTIGFPFIDPEARRAEIGYEVAPEYWGRGLATEAVRRLATYGFEELGLNRIEATTSLGNAASIRVLDKAGFTEEGVLREYRYWRGGFHDLRMFSLLRREYQAPPDSAGG
jgi:ribosomal-protein-alanine N-acetyltransferase